MAYLVLECAGERREIPVKAGITIGRHRSCAVRFNDKNLSRRHTRLSCDGGAWLIQDLGSTNGTYLNGERLREVRALRNGDKFKVGEAVFTFVSEEAAEPAAARPAPRPAPAVPAGPGLAARAFFTLALLGLFGLATYGFRSLFVWAFERIGP